MKYSTHGNMRDQLNAIKDRLEDLEIAINLLPDLGEIDAFVSELCFQADIPFSHEAIQDVTQKMTDAGWFEIRRYNREHAGDAVIVFKHPSSGRPFEIMLRPDYAGSTCQKKIVDYRKEPIYEIVCNEAE